jgi:hypothetical protein
VEETIARETVTAKKLCTAFGIMPPAFLEGAPDESYHPLLAVALSREFARRPKLPQYNTVEDAVRLLQESKNIVVLTGAGVSPPLLDISRYITNRRHIFRFQQASAFLIFVPKIPVSIRNWSILV